MSCDGGSNEIMLFGVRVKIDPLRKCVSMNNLSQYEQPAPLVPELAHKEDVVVSADNGYASADDVVRHQPNGGRERKRGVPWTEDEHKLFLLGLQKVGKGDWRGISRNFVKTRTPTQVASHAQKYFLRRSNLNRRRRRSSLFDITTDSVAPMPIDEQQINEDNKGQTVPQPSMPLSGFPTATFPVNVVPILPQVQRDTPMQTISFSNGDQVNSGSTLLVHPIPLFSTPNPSTRVYYVLEGPPIGVMTEEEERNREQDETLCRGYILSTLTDRLYDLYTPMTSAREI
ncbi:transcription factor MYB1R1-like protein [Tanacetum coccineum]